MVNLVDAMTEKLGGIDAVAAALLSAMEIGMNTRSPLATRCVFAMLNLQTAVEVNEPKLDLSPAAIEEQLMAGLTELIEQHPMLAVAAAERLGWEVMPPAEQSAFGEELESQ